MTLHRARVPVLLLMFAFAVSCKGEKKPERSDSAIASSPAATPPPLPVVNTGWDNSEAGPVILVAVPETLTQASVVLPHMTDSALSSASAFRLDSLFGLSFDLFDRSGAAGSASLREEVRASTTEGCLSWPLATLDEVGRHWRVGFRKGMARSLPLDSLEGAKSADSSLTTSELARLASALSAMSDPVFQGLPFAVRKAYWFDLGSTSVLVGDVVRKINEEANPREEHLLLIAEHTSGSGDGYVTAFHSRAAGSEELVRTNEILGAIRFARDDRAAIVVSFEYADGGRIALIERIGDRSWKITWRSAYTGC